jgi:hypothetical protein
MAAPITDVRDISRIAYGFEREGYGDLSDQVVIPEITKLVACTKPG